MAVLDSNTTAQVSRVSSFGLRVLTSRAQTWKSWWSWECQEHQRASLGLKEAD